MQPFCQMKTLVRMTTFLENLEMSGNFAVVRELTLLTIVREKILSGKLLFLREQNVCN